MKIFCNFHPGVNLNLSSDRQTDTERERMREAETERERHTHRQRQRQRENKRERSPLLQRWEGARQIECDHTILVLNETGTRHPFLVREKIRV